MTYEYIFYEERECYYVPRMSSLCAARQRDSLFQKYFGESPVIISPMDWEILLKKFKIKYLEV